MRILDFPALDKTFPKNGGSGFKALLVTILIIDGFSNSFLELDVRILHAGLSMCC
ncbi:hypothetical protein BN2476_350239 [Paraburkholderia piptadeniae]|uniref:Uncharacterized protein n=1 Tax=Paraburkholderia piptadeniae TaxID=1701573 RepID=A0A1N7S8I4_9BURK|nr:hypothetical protein BN2476_350239 [Paraburkholderia piptadeniae]